MALLHTSNCVPILSEYPSKSSEAQELLTETVQLARFHHGHWDVKAKQCV